MNVHVMETLGDNQQNEDNQPTVTGLCSITGAP